MAAGRTYDASTFAAAEELYNVKSGYRMAGGANLYVDDLSAQEKIPPLTPLYVVADNTYAGVKNAYVVRNARVQANFVANDTLAKIKIEKGSFWNVDDDIAFDDSNYGTISAIVTTNADYDEVEFDAAIPTNLTKGDVLFPVTVTKGEDPTPDTFVAERTANYLAYAPAKVEAGASVTLLGRAFEIDEDKLYIPVTDADKASLGDRFMFI